MAKDLILDVVAKKNSRDLSTLADEFDKLRKKVDDSSAGFGKNTKFSALLDKQLAATRDQVKQLGEEFDRTGDKDVFAKLGGAQKNLASLERIKKQLTSALDQGAQDAAPQVGQAITGGKFSTEVRSGIASALKSLPDIPLDADAGPAERRVAELRAELEALGREHVGITIDEKGAVTALAKIKAELLTLGGKNSALRVDTKAAAGDIAKIGGLFEQLGVQGAKALAKGVEDGADEGFKAVAKLAPASLQGALSTPVVGPVIAVALAGAVAAAGPSIASALGAAVISGGGLGLIGLGVAGQLKSPTVTSALDDLKDHAKDTLTEASASFAPVLVRGLGKFDDEIVKLEPKLEQMFDRVAPVADKLFDGAVGFIDKLEPGLDALSRAAGPVVGELANELPEVGAALADMLKDISSGGPQAALALHDVLTVVEGLTEFTGKAIESGEKLYGWLRVLSAGRDAGNLAAQLVALGGSHDQADAAAARQADGEKKLQAAEQAAATAANDLSDALDKLIGKNLSQDQAALQQTQSMRALSDSITQNGRHWADNTAAADNNKQALYAAIQAAEQKRVTDVASGKDAVAAALDYNKQVDALIALAAKAGASKAALAALKGRYEVDVQTVYLSKFISEGTPPSKFFHGLAKGGIRSSAGIRHAAVGMVIPPSNPGTVLAGEPQTGGEVLAPLRGISQGRAMKLAGLIGNAYGFDVVPRGARTPTYGGAPSGRTPAAGRPAGVTVGFAGNTDTAFSTAFQQLVRAGLIQISVN